MKEEIVFSKEHAEFLTVPGVGTQLAGYSIVVTRSVLAKTGLHSQQSSEGGALQATGRLQILQCEVLREKRKKLGIFNSPRWVRAACLLVEPSLVLARNTNKGEV